MFLNVTLPKHSEVCIFIKLDCIVFLLHSLFTEIAIDITRLSIHHSISNSEESNGQKNKKN